MNVMRIGIGVAAALAIATYIGLGDRGAVAQSQQKQTGGSELRADDLKAAAGQNWRTVTISSVRTVQADLVVPANVCLAFEDGGACDVREGATLVVKGPLTAPPAPIFTGAGKVLLDPTRVEKIYPQWWGAVPDDGKDDTAAIQAAIDSAIPNTPHAADAWLGGVVFFLPGRYEISSRLTFHNGLCLEGTPLKTQIYATKSLPAMLQRPDLSPPPEGIHFNAKTRVDGIRIANLNFDGGAQDSRFGLDLTNTNYAIIDNVTVVHCKTGFMMAQLGMYNTFINPVAAVCDVGLESNPGVMDNNIIAGRFAAVRVGLLINNTGHLNLYGTTFDAYKETAVELKGGDAVNLNNLWFDSVAGSMAIRIGPSASGCSIINPRFSGPTPKEMDIKAKDTVVMAARGDYGEAISLARIATRPAK